MNHIVSSKKLNKVNFQHFNFARGVGIILVIFAHTFAHLDVSKSTALGYIENLLVIVGPGIMPMFFMISGYGFKPKTPKKVFVTSARELLVPYFCVMLGYLIIFPPTYYLFAFNEEVYTTLDYARRYFLAFIFGISKIGVNIMGHEATWCVAAWYFLALFVATNISNLILKAKKIIIQVIAVLIVTATGVLLFEVEFYYFCLPQGLMVVPFVYMGHIFKKYNLLARLQILPLTYIILAPVLYIQFKHGAFDLSQGTFENIYLDYIGAALSGILFLCLFSLPERSDCKIWDWTKQIGLYSYWILIVHSIEMEAIPWWYIQQPISDHQWTALLGELFIKVIIYVSCCVFLKKLTKIRYQKSIQKFVDNSRLVK